MDTRSTLAHIGLDIGSTTVKLVVLDPSTRVLYARYQRHMSDVRATVAQLFREALADGGLSGHTFTLAATGSGAISLTEELGIPFVQEVIASAESIRRRIPDVDVTIELGGEDAKITFFTGGVEQRMNETCAGGTGAFIDQMAAFLNTDAAGLNELASRCRTIYPIASRCGVFAKTDILPLLNEGCAREDIAASIFQAVVLPAVAPSPARSPSSAGLWPFSAASGSVSWRLWGFRKKTPSSLPMRNTSWPWVRPCIPSLSRSSPATSSRLESMYGQPKSCRLLLTN